MLTPNPVSILFPEQSSIVDGLVLNQNLVQSADLTALNNFGSKNFVCLKLPAADPICIFASRKNTTGDTLLLLRIPNYQTALSNSK